MKELLEEKVRLYTDAYDLRVATCNGLCVPTCTPCRLERRYAAEIRALVRDEL